MRLRSFKQTAIFTTLFLALTACGYENIVPPAPSHVHTFSTEWTHNADYHWHEATCEHKDQRSDYAKHSWGNWVIDKEATEEESGLRHHTCTVCEWTTSPEAYDYLSGVDATRIYLSLDVKNAIVGVNSTKTLTPVIFPNDAKRNIKYIVSDPEIFEIENETGILTGKKAGSALITVYNDNNNNNELDENEPRTFGAYQVMNKNSSYVVSLPTYEYNIMVDEEITLNPSANFTLKTGSKWSTYAYNSPFISNNGTKIKGVKPGKANVVVYATPSGESISYDTVCTINVTDKVDSSGVRASEINFDGETVNLDLNQEFIPTYTISPNNSVDTAVTYTVKGDAVEYSDNKFIAKKEGTSIIEVRTPNNKMDRLKVVVSGSTTYEKNYNDYYGDLSWTDGEDLKAKLHNIISNNKKSLYYKKSNTANWDSNKDADSLIGDSTKVNGLYTDTPIAKDNTFSGWQREHCFAASLMTGVTTGDAVNTLGRATDFHNLYAAFASGNSARGNKNFGYAVNEPITIPDNGGSYKYENGYNGTFEPSDIDKGKVARAIMYMGVMYDSEETFKLDSVEYQAKPLQLIEDNVPFTSVSLANFKDTSQLQAATFFNNYKDIVKAIHPTVTSEDELAKLAFSYFKTTNNPSAIGHLSELLMWNAFNVDEQEMQHNNSVYAYNCQIGGGIQGNRNPFVDYPELAEYVYGSLKDQAGSLDKLRPSIIDLDMEPVDPPGPIDPDPGDEKDGSSIEKCEYSYIPAIGNASSYVGDGTSYVATFDNMVFDLTLGSALEPTNRNQTPPGAKFGTSSAYCGSFTLVGRDSLNQVEAVYFVCAGNSGTAYDWAIKVGNETVLSGKTTGNTFTSFGGKLTSPLSGKVTIQLTNVNNALNFCGIGIHYTK